MASSVREILRELSSKHSLVLLHNELIALMKEEYEALQAFFAINEVSRKRHPRKQPGVVAVAAEAEAVTAVAAVAAVTAVAVAVKEETLPLPQTTKHIANTKIRIIKRESSAPAPVPEAEATEAEATEAKEAKAEKRMSSKELKSWQKEQEKKKLDELTAQGVNPESLLTVENMKKWVEDGKRTYASVARDFLGIPESKVADFAKEHSIKTTITKKRAMIAASKKRSP